MIKYQLLFTRWLIILGKNIPFILCSKILFENIESIIALYNDSWYIENGLKLLYTPISWNISSYIRYDWTLVITLFILGVATHSCWRNKLAIYYLAFNLIERIIIENNSIDMIYIPYYLGINILIISIILFLGIQQYFKKISNEK